MEVVLRRTDVAGSPGRFGSACCGLAVALALLVGTEQGHLTTQDFLAAIDENLQAAMSAA